MRFSISWLLASLLCFANLHAQVKQGAPIKGFTASEGQSTLSGKTAVMITKELWQISGLKIVSTVPGSKNSFIIQATNCLYNTSTRVAQSPDELKVVSQDGKFDISGRGFLYDQEKGLLTISNEVLTTVQRPLPAGKTNPEPPIIITAGYVLADLTKRSVLYQRNVQAKDPRFRLVSDQLRGTFSTNSQSVETIEAEGHVDMTGLARPGKASAEHASYVPATESITLTGKARWELPKNTGTADRLVWGMETSSIDALGNVQLRLPKSESVGALFQATPGVTKSTATNLLSVTTDHFISETNRTQLLGKVKIVDLSSPGNSTFICDQLIIDGPSDKPDIAHATGGVYIQQGTRIITSDRADYSLKASQIDFQGDPAWSLDGRKGKAQFLSYLVSSNILNADKNVELQLPSGSLGGSNGIPFLTGTNTATGTNQNITLRAQSMRYSTNGASFGGGVTLSAPAAHAQTNFVASRDLDIRFTKDGSKIALLKAMGPVHFETLNSPAEQQRRLDCFNLIARWTEDGSLLEQLDADGPVSLQIGGTSATGQKLHFTSVSPYLELSGNPEAINPVAKILNAERLLWDWTNNRIAAVGNWKVDWKKPARTNSVPAASGASQKP